MPNDTILTQDVIFQSGVNVYIYVDGVLQENGCVCIFLELMKMGSLQTIMKRFQVFDEVLIRTYTRQILKGLEYLHAKNTVHRLLLSHLNLLYVSWVLVDYFNILTTLESSGVD